jgi:dephospho-CoA kinase
VVVLEAPLLVEAGWTSLADEVWVTVAPEGTVLKRLRERTGMTEEEALARIRSQLSSEERRKHADVVIDTDCTLQELKARVKELWEERAGKGS